MKHIKNIIVAIVGIFILLATIATSIASDLSTNQDVVTVTPLTDSAETTAEKEITNESKPEVDYKVIFEFAKVSIFECKTDKERISTYKWYKEIFPLLWDLKLTLYMDKTYPHLRYAIRH